MGMQPKDVRAKIIDEIIRYGASGTVLTMGVLLPGSIIGLSKPLEVLIDTLDKRERERELRTIVYRMKERGLLAGDYRHGLQVTEKARKRLEKMDMENLRLKATSVWDGHWRIVIYDIPEEYASARRELQSHLLRYGCVMMQKSAWITPFPCRDDIVALSAHYNVDRFITYFEAVYLDNAPEMVIRFKKRFPDTVFKIPKKPTIK